MYGRTSQTSQRRGAETLKLAICAWVAAGFGSTLAAEDVAWDPRVGSDVYWGDTHLHTRNSPDAYALGNRKLSQADAYRFARGAPLTAHTGETVQLRRPLDFLVVADHAEYLGGYYGFDIRDPRITKTKIGRRWASYEKKQDPISRILNFVESINNPAAVPALPRNSRLSIWRDIAETADEHNDPGNFTAFIGYEWTSMIAGNNLHRVVVYADGADKAARQPPFSAQDSTDPAELWQALARYEARTGGRVMAIPHNGNLSNGAMFLGSQLNGSPFDADYVALRSRFERLYEVTQVKGDSEAHPVLSPTDEFADYETWDFDNIDRSQEKEDWMLATEYARSALKLGLQHAEQLGTNPFQFGMIGSTDGHNTFSTTDEDNFWGKFPESERNATRMTSVMSGARLWANWRLGATGYAAVWAQDNTREALFDAMLRRETYATTGSRLRVRLFAGQAFAEDAHEVPDWVAHGYRHGVPMGGTLNVKERGQAPKLLIVATKDPLGAMLDRVQVIKGWLDDTGAVREQIFEAVWAGAPERLQPNGKLKPIGTTVDTAAATYRNTIGAAQLATTWTDPTFDAAQRAFYYVRVLEIPTPRWTTYDAERFNLELAPEIPRSHQERAYTSPIWVVPAPEAVAVTARPLADVERPSQDPAAADLVILNASVVTADPEVPSAAAVAIRNGRFLSVGTQENIAATIGSDTVTLDAEGRTLLPGFVDSHSHLHSGAGLATGVDLTAIPDQNEWLRLIAAKAAALPPGVWILGGAWDHNLSGGTFPTRAMLDAVAPEHPVLLRDIDGHSAWANSKAIERAGITAEALLPPGGKILLDDQGEPNGIFLEGAMDLFAHAPGMREATDPVAGLRAAVQLANQVGITTLHDMSGEHEAFLSLARQGALSVRVWQGMVVTPRIDQTAAQQIAAVAAERERINEAMASPSLPTYPGPLFTIGFAKFVVDGVLSSRTALMLAPYSDDPTARPEAFLTARRLQQQVAAAVAADIPVATHAIGDAAVRRILDAYEKHPPRDGVPGHRVEHIEVVAAGTIERFKALSVAASMQPHHATCCVGSYVIDRIGAERMPYAYVWRSFEDAGVPLLFSADWPTSPFSPLTQIADAMERTTMLKGERQPWDHDQSMTFAEALAAYTERGAAYTTWEADIGQVKAGKLADFVLLDRQLDTRSAAAVRDARVAATYLGGRQVYPLTTPENR